MNNNNNLAEALGNGLILLGYTFFNLKYNQKYHVVLSRDNHILVINPKDSTYQFYSPINSEYEKDTITNKTLTHIINTVNKYYEKEKYKT